MTTFDLNDSPVLVLEHNMTAAFETFDQRLVQLVASEKLNREVLLDLSASAPRTPSILQRPGHPAQLRVQVAFLELLWAFIYSWMVTYEETVQKAQLRGDPAGSTISTNESLVSRAEALWAWARGQGKAYTSWPSDLPSPRQQLDEVEAEYAGKANFVFERATSFLFCHELAHATLGHLEVVDQLSAADPLRQEMENEADQAAFSRLVGQDLDDQEKLAQAWAILSALLCCLYAVSDPRVALRGTSHPPLHHRLGHLMRSLAFKSEGYRYYFHFLCRLVLLDAFPNLARRGEQYEDGPDSLLAALDDLDRAGVGFLTAD